MLHLIPRIPVLLHDDSAISDSRVLHRESWRVTSSQQSITDPVLETIYGTESRSPGFVQISGRLQAIICQSGLTLTSLRELEFANLGSIPMRSLSPRPAANHCLPNRPNRAELSRCQTDLAVVGLCTSENNVKLWRTTPFQASRINSQEDRLALFIAAILDFGPLLINFPIVSAPPSPSEAPGGRP